jgi:hypothetical protein
LERIGNPVVETRWLNELLARHPGADEEVRHRVDLLWADIGFSKVTYLMEAEIRALGASCVGPLSAFLHSDKPEHQSEDRRAMAARIIRDVAEFQSIPDLVNLLDDRNPKVRFQIAEGLRRLTGRDLGASPDGWRDGTVEERAAWKEACDDWVREKRDWFTANRTST